MSLQAFRDLKQKRDDLVLVAQDLALIAAPYGTPMPEKVIAEDGSLLALPDGWASLGEVSKDAGVEIAPERKFNDIMGYGSMAPRRRIKESESVTLNVTPQEVTEIQTRMAQALSASDITNGEGSSGWKARKYAQGGDQYWSVLLIGFDGTADKPIYPWWLFDKMSIGDGGKQSLKTDSPLAGELQFTAYESTDGGMYSFGIGGAGWVDLSVLAGFSGAAAAPVVLTIKGAPTGGTFTLSFGGQTTTAIAYNATAATVQTELGKLTSIGAGNVQVTGTAGGPYTIAIDGSKTGTLTGSGTGLTGGTNTAIEITG